VPWSQCALLPKAEGDRGIWLLLALCGPDSRSYGDRENLLENNEQRKDSAIIQKELGLERKEDRKYVY
jgi:hypothetical protein